MEGKLKYIISFILFLFTILNFIKVSYYLCCAQDRHFFVIPIVQTEAPESYFVKGNKSYKMAPYFLKKHSFIKKRLYRISILYRDRFQRIRISNVSYI